VSNGETEKRVVRVTIFQQPYTLRASGDPADTEAVARGVDELMNQIADRTAASDASRIAVLAALHLADKVRQLERRAEELEGRVRESRHSVLEATLRAESADRRAQDLERREHERDDAETPEQGARLIQRLSDLDERLRALVGETPE
jgi:cell division protein ZapA (FtsZ GTPase activity inhibitor)